MSYITQKGCYTVALQGTLAALTSLLHHSYIIALQGRTYPQAIVCCMISLNWSHSHGIPRLLCVV
jgi:hypothetical protein